MKLRCVLRYILTLFLALDASGLFIERCAADEHAVETALPTDLTEIGLEALLELDLNVSVASKVSHPLRTSPGIVNLITKEDIRSLGSRDLVDLLGTIPGIQFGQDTGAQIGIASRGIWAFEGRALFLLDGVKLSKIGFGTFTMLNHIPLESIERIEIIRGPGSAIYGGNAELLVVSIITKKAQDVDGGSLTSKYSLYANHSEVEVDKYGQRSISASVGGVADDVSVVGHLSLSDSRLSNENYTSVLGESLNLTENSDLRNIHANIGIEASDFGLRIINDQQITEDRTRFGYTILPDTFPPLSSESRIFTIASDYKWNVIKDKLTFTPKFSYSNQLENGKHAGELERIYALDPSSDALYDIELEEFEYLGGLDVYYKPYEGLDFLGGLESFYQRVNPLQDPLQFFTNLPTVQFGSRWASGKAIYGQTTSDLEFGALTLGCRYDSFENVAGDNSAFVPRLSFTSHIDVYHLKLLYAQAFRAPNLLTSLNRLQVDDPLSPEESTSYEMEVGREIDNFGYLSVALFHLRVDRPIIYTTLPNGTQGLFNSPASLGTRGIELDFKTKVPWGKAQLAYAFYHPDVQAAVPVFMEPTDKSRYLGFSPHVVTGTTTFELSDALALTPSLVYLSPVNAITRLTDQNTFVYSDLDSRVLLNANLVAKEVGIPGLSLSLGAYNLLNDRFSFIQPYDGGHAPLPSRSREVMLSATINF